LATDRDPATIVALPTAGATAALHRSRSAQPRWTRVRTATNVRKATAVMKKLGGNGR